MFPKESDKLKNIMKVFYIASLLEQHRGNLKQVPERRFKDRIETLPSLCGISLDKGSRQCGFATEAFSEQGASRYMIIKLVNIHVIAQYLYEGNEKGDKWG